MTLEYTCIIGAASPQGMACVERYESAGESLVLWDPKWISRSARLEEALGIERRIEICATREDLNQLTTDLDALRRVRRIRAMGAVPWRVTRLIWMGEYPVRPPSERSVNYLDTLERHITESLALAHAVVQQMVFHGKRSEILVLAPSLQPPRGERGYYIQDPRVRDPRLLSFFLEADARRRFVESVGSTPGLNAAVSHMRVPDYLFGPLATPPNKGPQKDPSSVPTLAPPRTHSLTEILDRLAKQKPGSKETQFILAP